MKGCSSVLPGYVWCFKSHRFYLATKQFPNQSPNRAGDAVLPIAPPMCPNPNSKSPPPIPVVVGFKYINAQKSTALGSLGSLASRGPWQQRIVFEWSATGAKWRRTCTGIETDLTYLVYWIHAMIKSVFACCVYCTVWMEQCFEDIQWKRWSESYWYPFPFQSSSATDLLGDTHLRFCTAHDFGCGTSQLLVFGRPFHI